MGHRDEFDRSKRDAVIADLVNEGEINELNDQFREGLITAREYATKVCEIAGRHVLTHGEQLNVLVLLSGIIFAADDVLDKMMNAMGRSR